MLNKKTLERALTDNGTHLAVYNSQNGIKKRVLRCSKESFLDMADVIEEKWGDLSVDEMAQWLDLSETHPLKIIEAGSLFFMDQAVDILKNSKTPFIYDDVRMNGRSHREVGYFDENGEYSCVSGKSPQSVLGILKQAVGDNEVLNAASSARKSINGLDDKPSSSVSKYIYEDQYKLGM